MLVYTQHFLVIVWFGLVLVFVQLLNAPAKPGPKIPRTPQSNLKCLRYPEGLTNIQHTLILNIYRYEEGNIIKPQQYLGT